MGLLDELIEVLSDLVSYDTTINPDEGKLPDFRILDYLASRTALRSMRLEVLESGGIRNLVATSGGGRPVVMFMAHVDTVPFARDEWTHDPLRLEVEGDLAYGRGALDDKGNVAAVVAAAGMLGEPRSGTLVVALTGDEEVGGANGARVVRDYLASRGLMPDYLVNADGNSMVIINRRRAALVVRLRARAEPVAVRGRVLTLSARLSTPAAPNRHAAYFVPGVDSHPLLTISYVAWNKGYLARSLRGSFVKSNVLPSWAEAELVEPCGGCPEVEADAGLTALVRALAPVSRMSLRAVSPSAYGVTVTPNVYRRLGDVHEVVLDVRAMTTDAGEVRRAVLDSLGASGVDGEVEVEVEVHGGYLSTDEGSRIVSLAKEALASLGVRPLVREMAGASDAGYFSPLGVQVIDFGPAGGNIHGPDEYVSLSSLELTARFYYEVMRRLLT